MMLACHNVPAKTSTDTILCFALSGQCRGNYVLVNQSTVVFHRVIKLLYWGAESEEYKTDGGLFWRARYFQCTVSFTASAL